MNDMNVPKPELVLGDLADGLGDLTPELRKAAAYVLENPNDVGVSSIREIAEAAQVKPNTFVRMARSIGFEGYEDFRAPFREAIRQGQASFPDRARWLQSLAEGGQLGPLYADVVSSALSNIEETFAGIDEASLTAAAKDIWNSRQVFRRGRRRKLRQCAELHLSRLHRHGPVPRDPAAGPYSGRRPRAGG